MTSSGFNGNALAADFGLRKPIFVIANMAWLVPFRNFRGALTLPVARVDCKARVKMAAPFFTIGHSTRQVEQFVELLHASRVSLVVDVRSIPRSRANPQYNREALPGTLSEFQIGYAYIGELGGRRSHARDVPPSTNGYWENQSFQPAAIANPDGTLSYPAK